MTQNANNRVLHSPCCLLPFILLEFSPISRLPQGSMWVEPLTLVFVQLFCSRYSFPCH